MRALWQDVKFGLRMLGKNLGFTATAVATLALAIGANTAVFSILDPLLLRKLPVRNPDQLVLVHAAGSLASENISEFSAYDIYSKSPVFSGVMAYNLMGGFDVVRNGARSSADGEFVTGTYFPVLGVRPILGRLFAPSDDEGPNGGPVIVLNFDYWKRAFNADEKVIGQTLSIQDLPYTIIGVAPPGFFGIELDYSPDFYLPIHAFPLIRRHSAFHDQRASVANMWVKIIGRLKPGMGADQAIAELQTLFEEAKRASTVPAIEIQQVMARIMLTPVAHGLSDTRERYSLPGRIALVAVGLILLIACVNVANLQLARGMVRRREIAVRLALGSGRARLMRQLLVESALLALAGTAFALVAAAWAKPFLTTSLSTANYPVLIKAGLDGRVLWFTAGIATLTTVLSGLIPALLSTRADLGQELKVQSSASSQSQSKSRAARAMVIAQVAFCVTVLAATGLLMHSLINLETLDVGFDRDRVLVVSFDVGGIPISTEQIHSFYNQLFERAKNLPGVQSAALASFPPVSGFVRGVNVAVEGRQPEPFETSHALFNSVTPGYFQTMGIQVLAGRDFTDHDAPAGSAAIINCTMARHYFGDETPLGKRIRFVEGNRPSMEIIGVAADSKYNNLREQASDFFYVPSTRGEDRYLKFLVLRAHKNASGLAGPARQLVRSLNSSISILHMETMREQVDESLHQDRFIAVLCGVFSSLALVLTCVGLFGLLSFSVARRTNEIGVRMALGAQPGDVFRLVVGNGMGLVLAGLVIGAAGATAATSVLKGMLFHVRRADPIALGAVAILLMFAAWLACYLPARKAARTDPLLALRSE
jgi:predicted permease